MLLLILSLSLPPWSPLAILLHKISCLLQPKTVLTLIRSNKSSFSSMLRLSGGGCIKGCLEAICCCCALDAICCCKYISD
ncbi:hypothetical protein F4703DRAFT_1004009 [Phycomyces blakesleeanus]